MLFERGAEVEVRSGTKRGRALRARVVLDLGARTLIVNASEDPATAQRVPRSRVFLFQEPAVVTVTSLYCAETPQGLCVLQRQASPPGASELAEGQFTLCGAWATGRSKPKRLTPTCPDCRREARLPLLDDDA